jgi:hypothetical protein
LELYISFTVYAYSRPDLSIAIFIGTLFSSAKNIATTMAIIGSCGTNVPFFGVLTGCASVLVRKTESV